MRGKDSGSPDKIMQMKFNTYEENLHRGCLTNKKINLVLIKDFNTMMIKLGNRVKFKACRAITNKE